MTPATEAPSSRGEGPAPLELSGIGFEIGRKTILRDVSLTVHSGEVVCLLGQSGCGKTTLLRIAAGIEEQTSGSVRVAGDLVAGEGRFVPAEDRPLGLVFQDLALFPHMRVGDNVAYGARRAGAKQSAVAALAQVGLAGYERHYPHQLSGGEQQRVALMRALLPAPKVVLFDEPFSGLDRNLRDAVREEVFALVRARGATAVMVTHDPEEALCTADRIALMRKGALIQTATPEEIWRWPVDLEAARMFGPVNAFSGRAMGGIFDTPVGRVPVPKTADGTPLTVAFRPEAMQVLTEVSQAGVKATVERRRFFGGHVELTARVPGADAPLLLRAAPYAVPHNEMIRIVPDLRQAILFEGQQIP